MVHAHCVIDNKGHKHTLTVCNNCCISTATGFALKRLSFRLYVHCFHYSAICNVVMHYVTVGYATTKECYNEQIFFLNTIRMVQRTQMPLWTRRNTIGRGRTRVRMTCQAFTLWLERRSSPLLSFVSF